MSQLYKSTAPKPERQIPSVPIPTGKTLSTEDLMNDGKINTDLLISHFKQEGRLTTEAAKNIINKATLLFKARQNIVKIKNPAVIVGDIHGQFYDLLTVFAKAGMPPATRFVFLGDYVDRGVFGCEVLLLLYALKINFPHKVVLLRGNHESRTLTGAFNFRLEAERKYSRHIYQHFLRSFRALQLCAIVGANYFCVHGGISPALPTLKAILKLNRFAEPEDSPRLSDLLWADPRVEEAHGVKEFAFNAARRTSYFYGRSAAEKFLAANGLTTIVRGHEVKEEGFEISSLSPASHFPTVITVFSAPNYVDSYGNRAAFLRVDGEQINVKQFREAPHPYQLPNFQNVFEWSLPFVVENLAQLSLTVMKPRRGEDDYERLDAEQARAALDAMAWKFSDAPPSPPSPLSAAAPDADAKEPSEPMPDTPSSVPRSKLSSFLFFKAKMTLQRMKSQQLLLPAGQRPLVESRADMASLFSSVHNISSFITPKTFAQIRDSDIALEAYPEAPPADADSE